MPRIMTIKLKKDRFSTRRGGTSEVLGICCRGCGNLVIIYQKDGPGPLQRCYVDRIIYPNRYKKLQRFKSAKELPKLRCGSCDAVIGIPMRYRKHGENRLAFRMMHSLFKKRKSTKVRMLG